MSPEPPAPEALQLGATVWAGPARVVLSAYLLHRPSDAKAAEEPPLVAEARHATAPLPRLDSTLAQLDRALELCRGLRAKLQPLAEMMDGLGRAPAAAGLAHLQQVRWHQPAMTSACHHLFSAS